MQHLASGSVIYTTLTLDAALHVTLCVYNVVDLKIS